MRRLMNRGEGLDTMTARRIKMPIDPRPRGPAEHFLDDRRLFSALHESGHACAAIELGIAIKHVDIHVSEDRFGVVACDEQQNDMFWQQLREGRHTNPSVIDWVERKVTVLLAGGAAERFYEPASSWEWSTGHVCFNDWRLGSDLGLAFRWLQRLKVGPRDPNKTPPGELPGGEYLDKRDEAFWYPKRRLLSAKTLEALRLEFNERALALVEKLWPEIDAIARELLEHKILTQAEVRRLMDRARRHPRNKRSKS